MTIDAFDFDKPKMKTIMMENDTLDDQDASGNLFLVPQLQN